MRRFLYLRICAIIILVYSASILIYSTYLHLQNVTTMGWWFFAGRLLFLCLLGVNSVGVLLLYSRYYPDKEIPKSTVIFYRITNVIAIIMILFSLALFGNYIYIIKQSAAPERHYKEAAISVAIAAMLTIQVIGGKRLFKTIRANARKQLENSFA